jgi:hypothetical protein
VGQELRDFSGRVENQFEYIHRLLAAVESGDQQLQKELWHVLSDGQIKP